MNLEDFKFKLRHKTDKYIVHFDVIADINFWDGTVTLEINEDGDTRNFSLNEFEVLRHPEEKDIDGEDIFEGNTVHQMGVIPGCDIDFTGEVKFYNGAWYVDSGTDAVELFNECAENKIVVE
jgi:hypothetical protein